jgi:putative hemolysin
VSLVDPEEFAQFTRLRQLGMPRVAELIMELLKLDKVNAIYDEFSDAPGAVEFADAVLEKLGVEVEISEEELKRIPKTGPFISVSNHPFGGIDGIILIKILAERRPDFKVMANFLLQRIQPLAPNFIGVNPFENAREAKSNLGGLREALQHLKEGKPMGMFPAGEVSSYKLQKGSVTDRRWQQPALKIIRKAKVPVIPIYFKGSNSFMFHLLGMLHPVLRTAKLPSEVVAKKNKRVVVRIGHAISVDQQAQFESVDQYGRFLRMKTYALGNAMRVNRFFPKVRLVLKKGEEMKPVVEPLPSSEVQEELTLLREEFFEFSFRSFELFFIPGNRMPKLLQEIGRLREHTFRAVGEGTGNEIDVDEFDLYYRHLVLWDKDAQKLVGAYRVGMGADIMNLYGKRGFYFQSLFRLDDPVLPMLRETIELGRAFIVNEYQMKPYPLFLLWKGLTITALKNPQYRYFIGCVSISNNFSKYSKSLIIEFIKKNYYDYDIAQHVHPRKRFRVRLKKADRMLVDLSEDDVNRIDKLVEEMDPGNMRFPILLKKYIKQNARIVGFNVDPKFNNALDGLMILDLLDTPMETLNQVIEEIGDEKIIEAFVQRKKEEGKD